MENYNELFTIKKKKKRKKNYLNIKLLIKLSSNFRNYQKDNENLTDE